jgi:hypothetical protein
MKSTRFDCGNVSVDKHDHVQADVIFYGRGRRRDVEDYENALMTSRDCYQ